MTGNIFLRQSREVSICSVSLTLVSVEIRHIKMSKRQLDSPIQYRRIKYRPTEESDDESCVASPSPSPVGRRSRASTVRPLRSSSSESNVSRPSVIFDCDRVVRERPSERGEKEKDRGVVITSEEFVLNCEYDQSPVSTYNQDLSDISSDEEEQTDGNEKIEPKLMDCGEESQIVTDYEEYVPEMPMQVPKSLTDQLNKITSNQQGIQQDIGELCELVSNGLSTINVKYQSIRNRLIKLEKGIHRREIINHALFEYHMRIMQLAVFSERNSEDLEIIYQHVSVLAKLNCHPATLVKRFLIVMEFLRELKEKIPFPEGVDASQVYQPGHPFFSMVHETTITVRQLTTLTANLGLVLNDSKSMCKSVVMSCHWLFCTDTLCGDFLENTVTDMAYEKFINETFQKLVSDNALVQLHFSDSIQILNKFVEKGLELGVPHAGRYAGHKLDALLSDRVITLCNRECWDKHKIIREFAHVLRDVSVRVPGKGKLEDLTKTLKRTFVCSQKSLPKATVSRLASGHMELVERNESMQNSIRAIKRSVDSLTADFARMRVDLSDKIDSD